MKLIHRLLGGGDAAIARNRRPQELAASLDQPPREGIDWLGRAPGPSAPLLYRVLIAIANAFLFWLARLRLTVTGTEDLPSTGYIAVCATHRSWIDPLVLIRALPLEPRVWFMGSGATSFDRPWKERLLRKTGGLLPVWRGGTDISVHERSAAAVVESGGVLALFAEGRIGGPPDAPSKMRSGAALLCLRTGAPIVPIAICGAEELYRGKRVVVQILEPTTPAELLGPAWEGPAAPGTREELRQAHALTKAIDGRLSAALTAAYPTTVDAPDTPRRWRWLTRLLR
jgi:1-acyl-sn-glycerol-3-phosphate acyltransferase